MSTAQLPNYIEARNKVAEAREHMKSIAKECFAEVSKSVFDGHPLLEGFRWSQYTPYFADGDECTFGVNDVYIKFPGVDNSDYDDGFGTVYTYKGADEAPDGALEAQEAVKQLMKTFEEEDLKEMFGDHVQITVTRDGVDVEEYEHD